MELNEIKEKIEELAQKIISDKAITKAFNKNPVEVVEKLLGIDLPDAQIQQIIEGIKAKIDLDKVGGIGGIFGKLFGKKG